LSAPASQAPPADETTLTPAKANRARNLLIAAHAAQHVLSASLPVLLIFIREELDLSFTDVGIIIAVGNLTGGLAQFPAGLLVDYLGARSLLLAGYGLTLGGSLLFAGARTVPAMLLARVITGIGNATFHPGSFPEMARATRYSGVGMGMAMHNVGGNLGMSMGYSLTALLASALGWRGSLRLLVAVGAALTVAWVLVYPRLPAGEDEDQPKGGKLKPEPDEPPQPLPAAPRPPLAGQWLPVVALAAAAALSGAFGNTLTSFLPSFLTTSRGVSPAVAGAFSTIMLLSGTVGSIGGGRAGDRFDRSLVVLAATAATAVFVVALAWAPVGVAGLVLLLILVGAGRSIPRPCLNAITAEIAPKGKSGSAFGLVFGAMSMGGSLTSPMVGYIADRSSMPAAFTLLAGLFLVHGLLIRRLYAGKPALGAASRGAPAPPAGSDR